MTSIPSKVEFSIGIINIRERGLLRILSTFMTSRNSSLLKYSSAPLIIIKIINAEITILDNNDCPIYKKSLR